MFSWFKGKEGSIEDAIDRQSEEQLYQIVLKEMEDGIRRDGLWGKALTIANFDEGRAKSEYVRLRIQSIIDEDAIARYAKEKALADAEHKKRKEAADYEERIRRLIREHYKREQFEAWFFTTEYTHRQYDREYEKFVRAVVANEYGQAHNK